VKAVRKRQKIFVEKQYLVFRMIDDVSDLIARKT